MSRFTVTPEVVANATGRLGPVGPSVADLHRRGAAHGAAGADTPAADAIAGLAAHFSQMLPLYALSAAHLTVAVAGASSSYAAADAVVGTACEVPGAEAPA